MLRKGHGGLYKAPTEEVERKRKAKRRERSDQVYIFTVDSCMTAGLSEVRSLSVAGPCQGKLVLPQFLVLVALVRQFQLMSNAQSLTLPFFLAAAVVVVVIVVVIVCCSCLPPTRLLFVRYSIEFTFL